MKRKLCFYVYLGISHFWLSLFIYPDLRSSWRSDVIFLQCRMSISISWGETLLSINSLSFGLSKNLFIPSTISMIFLLNIDFWVYRLFFSRCIKQVGPLSSGLSSFWWIFTGNLNFSSFMCIMAFSLFLQYSIYICFNLNLL